MWKVQPVSQVHTRILSTFYTSQTRSSEVKNYIKQESWISKLSPLVKTEPCGRWQQPCTCKQLVRGCHVPCACPKRWPVHKQAAKMVAQGACVLILIVMSLSVLLACMCIRVRVATLLPLYPLGMQGHQWHIIVHQQQHKWLYSSAQLVQLGTVTTDFGELKTSFNCEYNINPVLKM